MRYILILLSSYLLFWNYLDLKITSIPAVNNLLPKNFVDIYLIYVISLGIILFIFEEIFNYLNTNKKNSILTKTFYLLPIWIWLISLLLSLYKLTNNNISGLDILLLVIVVLILSYIVISIHKMVLLFSITKKITFIQILFFFWLLIIFILFLLKTIFIISLDIYLILYFFMMILISILSIYFIFSKEGGYLLEVRKNIRKNDVNDFIAKLEVEHVLTDNLRDEIKTLWAFNFKKAFDIGTKIFQNLINYRSWIRWRFSDYKKTSREIWDKELKIKIPRNIKITQKKDDTFLFEWEKKSYIEAIYLWRIVKIPIEKFNEITKEFSIKKEFYDNLENKVSFIEDYLSYDLWKYLKNDFLGDEDILENASISDISNYEKAYWYFLWYAKIWNIKQAKEILKKYSDLDVNKVDNKNWYNPLLIATAEKQLDMVKYLLQKWADTSIKTLAHWASSLIIASQYWSLDIIKILVKYWANIDILDDYWKTPLMQASIFWHNNIVKYFLQKWANTLIEDKYKMTAYTYAKQGKYWEIMKMLLDYKKYIWKQ